jgi:hypothetical protein
MSCNTITKSCLSCNNGDAFWKGYANGKFPQTPESYDRYQTKVIGGINNSRNFGGAASSFTLFKKSLTTVNPSTLPSNSGPGDIVKSVPIITQSLSGNKARTTTLPKQTGVDNKHGSYDRYLARKKGLNLTCQC